jgi:hypothetical protein
MFQEFNIKVEIGQTIRSFDFPNTPNCYIEGVVVEPKNRLGLVRCLMTRRVFDGEPVKVKPGSEFGFAAEGFGISPQVEILSMEVA